MERTSSARVDVASRERDLRTRSRDDCAALAALAAFAGDDVR
jgi:hypothetical protein